MVGKLINSPMNGVYTLFKSNIEMQMASDPNRFKSAETKLRPNSGCFKNRRPENAIKLGARTMPFSKCANNIFIIDNDDGITLSVH